MRATTTPAAGPAAKARRSRGPWVNLILLAAVVALFAVPLALRLGAAGASQGDSYGGSDDKAVNAIETVDPGYRPWFTPLFEPSSGEVESGLFALQAALGAGAFGYAMGRLSGRRRPAPARGPTS
jgi:cobalt/nickel transport protein